MADPAPSTDLDAYRELVRSRVAPIVAAGASWQAGGREHAELPAIAKLERARALQQRLFAAGLAGVSFPVEYGGQGLTEEHDLVAREELRRAGLPSREMIGVSVDIIGRTLLEFGTPAQKDAYLPRMLAGELVFVQLLSEPSGGSDLAALLTRATRDGDRFLLNGQKVWSSGADLADFALCPARTRWDVPKRKGITVFIVDLRSPSVEIRPIRQIDGRSEFCEEFLTDVAVPADGVLGEVDGGWTVIRAWLAHEHRWAGQGNTERRAPGTVTPLVRLAEGRGVTSDPDARRSIASVHATIRLYQHLARRGAADPGGHHGGLLKISSDRLMQHRAEAGIRLGGPEAIAWEPDGGYGEIWARELLGSRGATLGGGSDEIQHNNIGESVLGLPREPSLTEDLPFDQVPHN